MVRLFAGKKDTKDQGIDVDESKPKRFSLFRRGRTETPVVAKPSEPDRRSPARKTKAFRISVYETRNESPTPTNSSAEESEENIGRFDLRERLSSRRRRSRSPSRRQSAPRRRSTSPAKRTRTKSPNKVAKIAPSGLPHSEPETRRAPERAFSDTPVLAQARSGSLSPRRGILKRAMLPAGSAMSPKPEPIASFNLEVARRSAPLTDNMSAESSHENRHEPTADYPLTEQEDSSLVIHPKRNVSFSKDVMDPKPKASGVTSFCLGSRSGRRVPRRRGDFSLTHEFEDLCYDLTYFCRCMSEVMTQDETEKNKIKEKTCAPNIPDDEQTVDSSTIPSIDDRSVGSI